MRLLTFSAIACLMAGTPAAFAQKGGVAILDIDKVAQELNVDQAVVAELKSIETQLNSELGTIRNNLQGRMTQLESQAGQQRTQQIQQQLVQANQQLNAQFNNFKAQAQNQLVQARVAKINEFRDKVRPIAQDIAKAKGLDVVLTKTPQVFANIDAVDITEDVIKEAKAAGLEAEVVPAAAPATGTTGAAPGTPAAPAPTTAPVPAKGKSEAPAGGKAEKGKN